MTHPYTRLFTLPAPPDADNDITEGYEIGDVVHVTGGSVYDCRDATEGAAVWEERTVGGGSTNWGGIGGTLSDQSDLQDALDLKLPVDALEDNIINGVTDKAPTENAVFDALALKLPTSYLDTDGTLAANSDVKIPSQKAAKTYIDSLIAANDALVYKGAIDASANPNYPAASAGHAYKISVAGKIGGASGPNVEVGDLILCTVDGSASGNHATVGANWGIIQSNLDGAVIGPASAVSGQIATFSGTSGKLIQDGGATIASLATGAQINAAGAETSIDTADKLGFWDASASLLKHITWSNLYLQLEALFVVLFPTWGDFSDHIHNGSDTDKLDQANTHQSPDTDSAASSLHHTIGGSATQAMPGNAWIVATAQPTYTSADAPIFVMSVPDAVASLLTVGNKIKLIQTTTKYFIIQLKGTPSGGNTPVTIHGGTDYTLANAAITGFCYSHAKSPEGFPMDDDKWTVSASNTANAHKTPPTQNVWYGGAGLTNTGISIDVPIGAWRGHAKSVLEAEDTTVTDYNCYMTFSTANNSESNSDNTGFIALTVPSGTYKLWSVLTMPLKVTVTTKTTHYLNIKTSTTTADAIHMRGDVVPTIIKLVNNYL